MKEYWVDVRFTVKANDEGDAANKVHEFVPDVEEKGDIIMWTLANSLIAKIPTCSDTRQSAPTAKEVKLSE